jgi:hypothetical protein
MACCVFAAWILGLVWRGMGVLVASAARLVGRRPPAPEPAPVAPAATRRVVFPRGLTAAGER